MAGPELNPPESDPTQGAQGSELTDVAFVRPRPTLHLHTPVGEQWLQWHTRTWREGRQAMGVPTRGGGRGESRSSQRCAARSACSIVGRVLRWRSQESQAGVATLRAIVGGSLGPGRRQRKGRPGLRWGRISTANADGIRASPGPSPPKGECNDQTCRLLLAGRPPLAPRIRVTLMLSAITGLSRDAVIIAFRTVPSGTEPN